MWFKTGGIEMGKMTGLEVSISETMFGIALGLLPSRVVLAGRYQR